MVALFADNARRMKKSFACFIGLALTAASLSAADTQPQYEIRNGAGTPKFQANAAPRQEKENYVAVWGGGNVFQNADFRVKDSVGYGINEKLSLKNQLGWAVGAKLGHTWNLHEITSYDKPGLLQFSLEGEFIYTATDTELKYGSAKVLDGNMDIYALMVNPILRFNFGTFRPYMGFGVGGALVTAKVNDFGVITDYLGVISDHATRSTAAFAFQGIAGTDIALSDTWSLFLEYKFLGLVGVDYDLTLDAEKVGKIESDVYGNHLITVGIKLHY
jgi:opacity protein-like surface antigen